MNCRTLAPLALLLPVLALAACQTTDKTPPKRDFLSSYRGMELQNHPVAGNTLVRQGDRRNLERYRRVMIEDVRVLPNRANGKAKGPTPQESRELAQRFRTILGEELEPHYQLTSRRSRDTLAVRAALTELQPSNPGVFVFNYLPYASAVTTGVGLATGQTPGAGSTAMEAEVVDSVTRRQHFAMVSRIRGSKLHPSGLEKWGQSEQAMRIWSRQIRRGIQKEEREQARETAGPRLTRASGSGQESAPRRESASRSRDDGEESGGLLANIRAGAAARMEENRESRRAASSR